VLARRHLHRDETAVPLRRRAWRSQNIAAGAQRWAAALSSVPGSLSSALADQDNALGICEIRRLALCAAAKTRRRRRHILPLLSAWKTRVALHAGDHQDDFLA